MKKILLPLLGLVMVTSLWADNISEEQAKQIAAEFFGQSSSARRAIKTDKMRVAYTTRQKSGDAALYVVNLGDENGFVLVSAYANADHPVLGWSDNGSFDYESAPIQLKDMLEAYSHSNPQRKSAAEVSAQGLVEMADGSFAKLVTEGDYQTIVKMPTLPKKRAAMRRVESQPNVIVEPLLKITWNQYSKYVDPYYFYVGCVPTAMAQVMGYWKYPARGRGYHTNFFVDAPEGIDVMELHQQWAAGNHEPLTNYYLQYTRNNYVNFGESVYHWEAMGNAEPETEEEIDNVAKLMYDCHVSCDPIKLPDGRGTGAYIFTAIRSMVKYFGYSPDYQFINCGGNEDRMRAELDAGRPFLMDGYPGAGATNTDGHAFVCDGYAEDGYFHFNFGWSGSGNGFYQLANVVPRGQDFSAGQQAAIGIRPSLATAEEGNAFINVTPEGTGVVCMGYGDVVVPATVEKDGKTYAVTKVDEYAFSGSQGGIYSFFDDEDDEYVTSVTLPETMVEISSNVFCGKEVTLPSSIIKCNGNIYNTSLERINVPSIEAWLKIDFDPDEDGEYRTPLRTGTTKLYVAGQELTDLVIPSSIKEVWPGTFWGYNKLNSVTMEEGVEKIGDYAFANNPLKEIKMATTLKEIGKKAFYNHEASTITIPANLMRIGKDALFGEKVEEYIVDEENTKYSSYQGILYDRARRTLIHCPNLLPGFTESTKRMSVGVPSTVTTIREHAFGNNLVRLTLPASVSSLSDRAFENTAKLKDLYLYRSQPLTITENMFHRNATSMWNKVNVHVPVGASEAYKAAPIWQDMNIVEDENVTDGGTPPVHYDYATDNNAIWIMAWMPDETGNYTTREFYILFDTQPVITHQDKSLLITADNSRYVFEEEVISDNYFAMRFTHYDVPTGIEDTKADQHNVVIRTEGDQLCISGLEAQTRVTLYGFDGRLLTTASASSHGDVSIPIPASDLIVVKAGNHSFKIHTKK